MSSKSLANNTIIRMIADNTISGKIAKDLLDIVWTEGFGWANVEKRVPITPNTLFRIGHTSKVLTAAGVAVAPLAVRGKVRRLAMDVQRSLVRVGFVEQEEVGVGGRPVHAIDEASRLGGAHRIGLLRQQRGQGIALAFRSTYSCDDRQYIAHCLEFIRDVGTLNVDWP